MADDTKDTWDRSAFLTIEEAAALLKIHPATAKRLAQRGELKGAIKIGGVWRVRSSVMKELGYV